MTDPTAAPRATLVRACALAWLVLAASACEHGAPPPRDSPALARADSTETIPRGTYLAEVSTGRASWAYQAGYAFTGQLELHDAAGALPPTYAEVVGESDVAPDRTAAVCGGDHVQTYDGRAWSTTMLDAVVGSTGRWDCAGIAARARDDVWLEVHAIPEDLLHPPPTTPADRVCHLSTSGWACAERAARIAPTSLVATPGHVWWVEDGELVAIPLDVGATPRAVAAVGSPHVQADPTNEAVLLWGTAAPELLAIDGTRTSFVATPESGAYDDVWLAPDGRVLAVEKLQGGHRGCSSGFFDLGGAGCGTIVDWTQSVVYELSGGPPVELGHVDQGGAVGAGTGVDRAGGAYLVADGWYGIP